LWGTGKREGVTPGGKKQGGGWGGLVKSLVATWTEGEEARALHNF